LIIDFRYHIASLVAVFLALAIGVLIGSTMNGDELITQQQKEIINRLEQDFSKLRQENLSLHKQRETVLGNLVMEKKFEEVILPIILNQRLIGQNLAIVVTNKNYLDEKWHRALIDNLQEAGAAISLVLALPQDLGLGDPRGGRRIRTELGIAEEKEKDLFILLAKQLAKEAGGSSDWQVSSLLGDLGVARVFPGQAGKISGVILVGGGQSLEEGKLDRILVQEWKRMGLRVIGVEPKQSKRSFMNLYQKWGISTIDSIDCVPSQVTLVWLLQQGKEGNYGFKPSAEQMFPDLITY